MEEEKLKPTEDLHSVQSEIHSKEAPKTDEIEKRKENILNFAKKKASWIYYLILAGIIYVAVYIRTLNMPRLRDITTNTWTLGPDLDPFLFLRWAKEIVANGSLASIDMMRYFPLGYSSANEMKLLAYLIAGFHKLISIIYEEATVTYSAVLFPAVMFGLTAIAFFLFARKVVHKQKPNTRNIIALLATAFFVLVPSLLPRTIAGIPEKESVGFLFMFLTLYFFLEAFTSEKLNKGIIFGVLSGISTALMALTWGGMVMLFLSIPIATLTAFIIGKVKWKEFCIYLAWFFSAYIFMMPYLKSGIIYEIFASTRYEVSDIVFSVSTSIAVAMIFLIGASLFLIKKDNKKIAELEKRSKLPKELFYVLFLTVVLGIIVTFAVGPAFIMGSLAEIKNSLVSPLVSRFGLTVAENKQPYFTDWEGSFGPIKLKIPLFFWMFFIGAVTMFSYLVSSIDKRYKRFLIIGYLIFLISLIFSRSSAGGTFNGDNGISILLYFGGAILFFAIIVYCYKKLIEIGELDKLKEIDFGYVLYLVVFTLGLIIARGGIRFIMVLGAIAPVAIAFLVIKTAERSLTEKGEMKKLFLGGLAIALILASIFTLWAYYKEDSASARGFAPGPYQWQWQKAMEWVRENTPESSVFIHWWDYGYWVQSIGERATALDGGNAIGYWNHLMGRYGLTGPNETEALEFFYPHKVTHLLIDSTDIGKYTAFSSIGSDDSYDRFAWISNFGRDDRQTRETQNETFYMYTGGASLDDDIMINGSDGREILLPRRAAGIAAIIVGEDKDKKIKQPEAIFVYNNQQYSGKLRYAYSDNEFYDFGSGIDAGVFLFPRLDQTSDGRVSLVRNGVLMYLGSRTVHSQLARLYLFEQESDYFKLAYSQDGYIVENLKSQGLTGIDEFVWYQGLQGPIKIWEVTYPKDIQVKEDFLRKDFPNPEFDQAKPGEY